MESLSRGAKTKIHSTSKTAKCPSLSLVGILTKEWPYKG